MYRYFLSKNEIILKNNRELVKKILANTVVNVQYKLINKRINQRIFIDIRDCTDQLDCFNLMSYLNDKLQPMYRYIVKTSKEAKEYLSNKQEKREVLFQFLAYRTPYPNKKTPLFNTYCVEINQIEDVIESFIGYYLDEIGKC